MRLQRKVPLNKYLVILILGGLLWIPPDLSGQTNAGYAGSFLRMGLGARGISMANALPSGSNDVYGFFYNPAVLPGLQSRHFGTTYGFLPLDRVYNYVGYAMPLPPTAGIGIGWFSTGVDDIQGRNFSGAKIGTYTTRQHTYMLAFGNQFSERVRAGVLLKIMRNDLDELQSTGVGIDLGVIVRVHPRAELAATVQHLNAKFSWNTEDVYSQGTTVVNRFPLLYRVGGKAQVLSSLNIYGEYERSDKGAVVFRFAGEWKPMEIARVRVGTEDGEIRLGAGLEYGFLGEVETSLDYGLLFGRVGEGASHYFSWAFRF